MDEKEQLQERIRGLKYSLEALGAHISNSAHVASFIMAETAMTDEDVQHSIKEAEAILDKVAASTDNAGAILSTVSIAYTSVLKIAYDTLVQTIKRLEDADKIEPVNKAVSDFNSITSGKDQKVN